MFNDILEIFKEYKRENGIEAILENYKMKQGFYIVVDDYKDIDENTEMYDIEYLKKAGIYSNDYNSSTINMLKELDMYSNLISINKAVDSKKKIHSNNGYAFFIKRKTLDDKEILNKSIDLFFDELRKDKLSHKTLKLELEKLNNTYGELNINDINSSEEWVKKNIYKINEILNKKIVNDYVNRISKIDSNKFSNLNKKIASLYKSNEDITEEELIKNIPIDDRYIKIFFTKDIENVKAASDRYLINKIALKNDYNTIVNEKVFGVSSFNTVMNSKKQYSINNTRSIEVLNLEEIDNLKELNEFNLLIDGYASESKNNIYIGKFADGKNSIKAFSNNELDEPFEGMYMRVFKSKSVDVLDWQYIKYTPNIHIPIINEEKELVEVKRRKELLEYVDYKFFSRYLINSMYTDANSISDSYMNFIVKESLNSIRKYFIYGEDLSELELENIFNEYIKYSVIYDKSNKTYAAIMWKMILLNRLEYEKMDEMKARIVESLNSDDLALNNLEMQFLSGQLLKYYSNNVNNRNSKKMLLKVKNSEDLKKLLNKSYSNIKKGSKRGNQIQEYLILNLNKCSQIEQDMLILGYLADLIIFDKPTTETFI